MLNGLDLFSGIGGLSIALREWVRTIAYCEIDPYCRGVLLSRMASGDIPLAAIWDDVCTLQGVSVPPIDVIYGGFPCQDISVAGNGKGLEGERSGLVFEVFRLINEIRPTFVFLENVPAIRTRGAERVVKELATLGYDTRWDCISAYDMGAPHKRERWFLLAHANRERCEAQPQRDGAKPESDRAQRSDANGLHRTEWGEFSFPGFQRMDDGVPAELDRLRALGNAVVPAQAREAFRRLMGISQLPEESNDTLNDCG